MTELEMSHSGKLQYPLSVLLPFYERFNGENIDNRESNHYWGPLDSDKIGCKVSYDERVRRINYSYFKTLVSLIRRGMPEHLVCRLADVYEAKALLLTEYKAEVESLNPNIPEEDLDKEIDKIRRKKLNTISCINDLQRQFLHNGCL